MYVVPIHSILGKLPVVPVGDTGTITYHLHNYFPGAPGDRRPGAGDAECVLSIRGHWGGPMICNEIGRGVSASAMPHTTVTLYRVAPPC